MYHWRKRKLYFNTSFLNTRMLKALMFVSLGALLAYGFTYITDARLLPSEERYYYLSNNFSLELRELAYATVIYISFDIFFLLIALSAYYSYITRLIISTLLLSKGAVIGRIAMLLRNNLCVGVIDLIIHLSLLGLLFSFALLILKENENVTKEGCSFELEMLASAPSLLLAYRFLLYIGAAVVIGTLRTLLILAL